VAVTNAALPALRNARGRIVNMSSIGGRLATPFFGPYNASKFALEAVTDALRLELRDLGVYVVAVEPAAVTTPIWGKGGDDAERLLVEMPPEALELYGRGVEGSRRCAAAFSSSSAPACRRCTSRAPHALTAQRPRTRYAVGRDTRIRLALARLLPARVMDRLIARAMGL
jgi:NAD(P)-dependent dehydrogenase (short-subunit alcohol dehydrogenase family)